jgi:hypothetical protein
VKVGESVGKRGVIKKISIQMEKGDVYLYLDNCLLCEKSIDGYHRVGNISYIYKGESGIIVCRECLDLWSKYIHGNSKIFENFKVKARERSTIWADTFEGWVKNAFGQKKVREVHRFRKELSYPFIFR